jgi:NAD-dependent dihydropyrimidine dehydrogenase PreA subunit
MKTVRKIIKINEELCDGCGLCVPDCAEGSLKIVDGKARLVADKLCDGLGACLGACPTGALEIIAREADEFDEEAVEKYLAEEQKKDSVTKQPSADCGCASTHIQSFMPQAAAASVSSPCKSANAPAQFSPASAGASALTHWPVQIRLIPAHAPFLQNAHLLVAADCTAVAARSFQEKYMEGKTVMMGCPKFDDADSYVQRFAEIIATCNLQSLTVLIMEVPCCSAMNVIIQKAMERAGKTVPVEQVTITTRGEELARKTW